MHLLTVADRRVDPLDELGVVPEFPTSYWGWGVLPDQYGRRFADDDGEGPLPENPDLRDLPPLEPWWGEPKG